VCRIFNYFIFIRQNPTNRQVLVNGNANSVTNSNYRGSRSTIVIVHGWTNTGNSECNIQVRDAFLANQDCNVIVVDWSGLAGQAYATAVNGVPNVGQFLGNFLSFARKHYWWKLEQYTFSWIQFGSPRHWERWTRCYGKSCQSHW
jgi:pimeloyl-ACP methyl ester carboxylesterase